MTVRNSNFAKFGTQERQTPVEVYADHRGPRYSEKLVEEQIQSHFKEHTRKLKGDQKVKHQGLDPWSGVYLDHASRSIIARTMWGRNPKLSYFSALRNQLEVTNPDSLKKLIIPSLNAWTSALEQVPPFTLNSATHDQSSPGRNDRSPSYYGSQDSTPDSTLDGDCGSTKRPRRAPKARDVENIQSTNVSVMETVQSTKEKSRTM